MTIFWILLAIAVSIAIYVMTTYNKFVSYRVNIDEAWSDIEVQMKRRYNLVPNLIETIKGYVSHEKGTLEAVTQARAAAMNANGSPEKQAGAENMLSGALKTLFAVTEAYPDLKADQGFLDLQAELSALEDHIQKARRFYNGNVRVNNTLIAQFPSNLVANAFKFVKAEFFELDAADAAEARKPPKVEF